MSKAMIFDMDGVLIDSEPWYLEVNYRVFSELGICVSEQEYQSYVGITDTDMWTRLIAEHDIQLTQDQIREMQYRISDEYYHSHPIPAIKGIEKILLTLMDRDWKLALASSAPSHWISKVLAPFPWSKYLGIRVSGTDIQKGKPAPDIFLKAAQHLDVDSSRCCVIEDSAHGITAAKSAGMMAIAYKSSESKQILDNADIMIHDYADLNIDELEIPIHNAAHLPAAAWQP